MKSKSQFSGIHANGYGAYKMDVYTNVCRAFKCRGITPDQEAEIGRAMMAHELPIDRSYLDDRLNCTAFPNRTEASLSIMRHINDLPEGTVIARYELVRAGFNVTTVANVLKKLAAGRGITQTGVLENGRKLYRVFPANRVVLEEILRV